MIESRPGAKETSPAASRLRLRARACMPAAALLGGLWLATWALLLLPDVLLYWRGYPVNAATSPKAILFAGGIALLITMAKSRRFRMAAIVFVALNQIIWTGYVVYFRQALSPEQLLLVQHEATDTVIGVWDDWRSLLPWLVTLLAGAVALAFIQWGEGPHAKWRSRIAGATFVVVLVGACTAWMMHPRIAAAFPGRHTASMYGPFQAAVGAVRMELTRVAASSLKIHGQTQTQQPIGAEPVTVVVIMGESINPARLSLFGFKNDTTPQLATWRSSPPAGFALIPEMGFSGGLDTYASVPGFLRAAYWPVRGQEFGVNLFELAHKQGFKSWYFSAQTLNFLQAAGGAPHAERVQTVANDDGLAELAQTIPEGSDKSFVFLHQRVNHTPYSNNCAPAPKGLFIFDMETGSNDDRRRAAYDNGLRCWDRDVNAIVQPFLKRSGAVHIFITSDHSELMAENGSWGHGFTDLRVAMVPMMLLTNRPQSEVATLYKSWSPPTTYHLAQTVAQAFGVQLETPGTAPDRFFLNNTMPFALAGFMEVEQLKPGQYRVKNFARNGQMLSEEITNLPEVEKANAGFGPPEVLSTPLEPPPAKTGKAG